MTQSERFLDLTRHVTTGTPFALGELMLVPLVARDAGARPAPGGLAGYELLEDALAAGHTVITEVSSDGVVGEVLVRHQGARPLLVLDGEEIIGAKQNRAFNASFLVPAGSEVRLPVSCVERGRWSHASPRFGSAGHTVVPSVRAAKVGSTVVTMMNRGGYASDQERVWRGVRGYSAQTQVSSATEALSAAMADERARLGHRLGELPVAEGQVGLAAVAGDRLLAADVLADPGIYRRVAGKIARGMAAEALVPQPRGQRAADVVVTEALAHLASGASRVTVAPGSGHTLVGRATRYVLSALLDGAERLVHAVVVPA